METKDYIKQLTDPANKDKIIDVPTELPDDFKKLVNGLTTMNKLSYDYIKMRQELDNKDISVVGVMKELNCAGTNIQFATSQLIATYNAYYDLVNKITEHNKKVNEETKA